MGEGLGNASPPQENLSRREEKEEVNLVTFCSLENLICPLKYFAQATSLRKILERYILYSTKRIGKLYLIILQLLHLRVESNFFKHASF